MTLQEMRERLAALHEQATAFQNRLTEGEELNEQENEQLESVLIEITPVDDAYRPKLFNLR